MWYIPDSSPSKYFGGLFHCRYARCVPGQISDHCEEDYKLHLFQIVHYALCLSIRIFPFFQFSPNEFAAKLLKVSVSVTDSTPVLSGKTSLKWAMVAALNPSMVFPPFAILPQRTSSPLYSRQTKRISCSCPFGMIFCSVCFPKILCIGFCENKKSRRSFNFCKSPNTSAQSFDLIAHYSIFLAGSYSRFFIMSKTKDTNFFAVNALWVNHFYIPYSFRFFSML